MEQQGQQDDGIHPATPKAVAVQQKMQGHQHRHEPHERFIGKVRAQGSRQIDLRGERDRRQQQEINTPDILQPDPGNQGNRTGSEEDHAMGHNSCQRTSHHGQQDQDIRHQQGRYVSGAVQPVRLS